MGFTLQLMVFVLAVFAIVLIVIFRAIKERDYKKAVLTTLGFIAFVAIIYFALVFLLVKSM